MMGSKTKRGQQMTVNELAMYFGYGFMAAGGLLAGLLVLGSAAKIGGQSAFDRLTRRWHLRQIGQMLDALEAKEVPHDAGPFEAGWANGRAFVQSDDFRKDARLYITGDFYNEQEQRDYAEWVARALTAAAIRGVKR